MAHASGCNRDRTVANAAANDNRRDRARGAASGLRPGVTDPRLKSEILVRAGLRLCSQRGIPAAVVRRGDADAGEILVKLNRLEAGCQVLIRALQADGRTGWLSATGDLPVPESEAEACIGRQVRFDPDLWVIEVEDRNGRNPFDDSIG